MPLSWNEINKRAIEFSNEWKDVNCERSESKSFWDSFFNVFGISRKRIATFEEPVKLIGDKHGFIDLFWKGTLLVEHKSKGKSLGKAYTQALDYFSGLKEYELPKYVLVSDFERFRLFDLEDNSENEFNLTELHKNIHLFGFIAGYRKQAFKDQDPVNIKAAELMGKLHDRLLASGYSGHQLEVLLVRILFCLFADDTGIFEKGTFTEFVEQVAVDGADTGSKLAHLFQVLDTPEATRHNTLDERLSHFRYINGKLFEEPLPLASFDSEMRDSLLECCYFDWSQISPAIFGSLFQSVMDPEKRRNIGAHYTSEKNILKVIKPLFLDELQSEFDGIRNVKTKLRVFHDKIAALKFFDPACGCGNFLVITYRELRLLEIEILKILHRYGDILDIKYFSRIDVDSFYGIEIEEFPARIAEVAMWLMDHQMNIKLSEAVGDYFVRLPLQKSANIANANALQIDWNCIMHGNCFDYIFGNPPFIGKHLRNSQQNSDMDLVFQDMKNYKSLDYVTCWYLKAAQYIQNTKAKVAFVSTNSISQGEQPGILWNELYQKYHIKIHFGHRTFRWNNEARGMAHVYVVIIGFANHDTNRKYIYYYDKPDSEAHEMSAININPYLVEMSDVVVLSRKKTICKVPEIIYGNKPVDDGNLILTDDEKIILISSEPLCNKFIRPLISAKEYLNNQKRWCLWLVGMEPGELKQLPDTMLRVKRVREFRLASKKMPTQKTADTPALFAEIRQPADNYILIPRHTSESRKYIPFGFFSPEYIVHDSCACIPNATLYHFGVLSSEMHMIWMRYVCGRLESRFRYSNDIVYNNFPWPDKPSDKNFKAVEQAAQRVLDVRKEFTDSSLADLYDPLSMPPALSKTHKELDKAVDLCYRPQAFTDEMKRIEYLFAIYRKYIEPLLKKKKIT
ncbi:MAG: DNA methyltransferase [Victivallales bacterium]